MACAEQVKSMGFASIMNVSNGAIVQCKKCRNKGKGRKGAGVATLSTGANAKAFMPVKLISSRESHVKAMAVDLEDTNAILPSPLYIDAFLPLVVFLAIFMATLDSDSIDPNDKE